MTDEILKEFLRVSQNMTKAVRNLNFARPNLPLPSYTGRGNEKSFSSFTRDFNRVGNASGWNEEDACKIFPSCLRGEASAMYESLTNAQKTDWHTLLDTLAQKLARGNEVVASFRRQANTRKQRPGKSLAEFADCINELVKKNYPDADGFTNAMSRNSRLYL